MGLGDKAFTYQTVMLGMVSAGCLITMFILDRVGRRKVLIVGCFFQVFFMLLVAGLGTQKHKTSSNVNGVVAGVIFFYVFEKVSLSLNAYVIAAEIGGLMRKKSESHPFRRKKPKVNLRSLGMCDFSGCHCVFRVHILSALSFGGTRGSWSQYWRQARLDLWRYIFCRIRLCDLLCPRIDWAITRRNR